MLKARFEKSVLAERPHLDVVQKLVPLLQRMSDVSSVRPYQPQGKTHWVLSLAEQRKRRGSDGAIGRGGRNEIAKPIALNAAEAAEPRQPPM